jgi:hypothetical protein
MMATFVTHEHVRILLPRYAAGDLTSPDADAVRTHLATGCTDCLEALFRMPIGMPRELRPVSADRSENGGPADALPGGRIPAPAGPASGAGPSWVAGAVGLAFAVAAIAWLLWAAVW